MKTWKEKICWAPEESGSSTGGEPAAPQESGFEPLDIFSMDFENEGSVQAPEGGENPSPEQPAPVPSQSEGQHEEAGNVNGGASPEPATPSEPAPVEPAQPAQPTPAGPSAEELLAQALEVNKRLSEQLAYKESPKQPSQPEEDEDTRVFAERKPSDYSFTINPQLYEGLFSAEATQEQRIQCLQAYASGIATAVHNNILASLGKWTKQNFEAVPGAIKYIMAQTNQATQTSAQIRQEFYTKNPDLKRPELYPLIKATIQAVQKETKAQAWSPAFADSVASRVRQVLSGYAQATKPAAAAPIITPAAAKPAPKPQVTDPNGMDAIMATLTSDF